MLTHLHLCSPSIIRILLAEEEKKEIIGKLEISNKKDRKLDVFLSLLWSEGKLTLYDRFLWRIQRRVFSLFLSCLPLLHVVDNTLVSRK